MIAANPRVPSPPDDHDTVTMAYAIACRIFRQSDLKDCTKTKGAVTFLLYILQFYFQMLTRAW